MRIKSSMRPTAALAALALTSAAVVGVGGAAQAAPSAHGAQAQSNPIEVTIEWDDRRAYGGGVEGVLPGEDENFDPATVNVFPADAEGTVRFEAIGSGVPYDLGSHPVVDGQAVAPTWVLPGGPVEGDTSYVEWYGLTAEFVPDDPAEYQAAVTERTYGWVQAGNRNQNGS